jgi:hypothetical protein
LNATSFAPLASTFAAARPAVPAARASAVAPASSAGDIPSIDKIFRLLIFMATPQFAVEPSPSPTVAHLIVPLDADCKRENSTGTKTETAASDCSLAAVFLNS